METKSDFQEHLTGIQDELSVMGAMATRAISRAIQALKERDLSLAHQIMADDVKVNRQRFAIEEKCIQLIAAQQLAVADLRTIVAVFNITTELERIGDYAEGIAKIVIMIGDEPPLKPLIDIPRMAEVTIDMINKCLTAFVARDVGMAKHVITLDTVVDGLYDQVFRELLTFMMVDPRTINRATRLIWVAHNLERAADRATNISERVIFSVTGKVDEMGNARY